MNLCSILPLSKISTFRMSWGESTEGEADGQRMDGIEHYGGTAMCQKGWFPAKCWLLFVFSSACMSAQIFCCLFRSMQLAGNLSQLVKKGSQMCRQPEEKWHQMQATKLQGEHGCWSSAGTVIWLSHDLWFAQWHGGYVCGTAGHNEQPCRGKSCGARLHRNCTV